MRGTLVLNGNIEADADFVERARPFLLDSRHEDPRVAASRKTLLVTAGWLDDEYREGHVKEALYAIGIDGRGDNVQNLALYHRYSEFLASRPHLADAWVEREAWSSEARTLYLEKNSFYIAGLRRSLQRLREFLPEGSLASLLENQVTFGDGRGRLADYLSHNIRESMGLLLSNDDQMVALLHDLDDQFLIRTGLYHDPEWNALRSELSQRLLSSNSVFMFGGNLAAMHRCLNFFRLRPSLLEALRRGTSFYTVSAGSLVCCERIIVYNDFESEREFQLYDRGFGLVRELQLFPHCMDRIQTDDSDNLTYLSQRFRHRVCVGLNQESFLRVEFSPRLRATSLGTRDGVYVFDRQGRKNRLDAGQELLLSPSSL